MVKGDQAIWTSYSGNISQVKKGASTVDDGVLRVFRRQINPRRTLIDSFLKKNIIKHLREGTCRSYGLVKSSVGRLLQSFTHKILQSELTDAKLISGKS